MKHAIIIIMLTALSLSSSRLKAQTQISGTSNISALLPRVECDVIFKRGVIKIEEGNKTEQYHLIGKDAEFNNYNFVFEQRLGNSKATFTILVDGKVYDSWTFSAARGPAEKTVDLNNMAGKSVFLKVTNLAHKKEFNGSFSGTIKTNSMLSNKKRGKPSPSNRRYTRKVAKGLTIPLATPCNKKGTLEITRFGAEGNLNIRIEQWAGGTLKDVTMSPQQQSMRINFTMDPYSRSDDFLDLVISYTNKNNDDSKEKVRFGAYFN